MKLRWVTLGYLVYLAMPIALLVIGSFGDLWLNTLLPKGLTTRWYEEVMADPSFRRAFASSLFVAASTAALCVLLGLPLAYAILHTTNPRVRALVRILYQLPVALPALVLAFGFILVFFLRHAPLARQHLAAGCRACRARAPVLLANRGRRHATPWPAEPGRRGRVSRKQRLPTLFPHRSSGSPTFDPFRTDRRHRLVDR